MTEQTNSDALARYDESWDSLCRHPVPDWFRDDKFGIYTHWGAYTVPAYGGSSDVLTGGKGSVNSAWYPMRMYREGHACNLHHVKTYGPLLFVANQKGMNGKSFLGTILPRSREVLFKHKFLEAVEATYAGADLVARFPRSQWGKAKNGILY
jgi:hypothetical protein